MELPKRKPNRLPNFDYSAPGAYFITICTKDKRNLFWTDVGASIARPQLTRWGKVAANAICDIPKHYPAISVDRYVVMPNHIHLLLQINTDENGRPMVAPTVSRVVQQLKGYVTKRIGYSIWQKLYYDHVIRGREDYNEINKYIYENPARWFYDELYSEE